LPEAVARVLTQVKVRRCVPGDFPVRGAGARRSALIDRLAFLRACGRADRVTVYAYCLNLNPRSRHQPRRLKRRPRRRSFGK
jgi:hypothetical protein